MLTLVRSGEEGAQYSRGNWIHHLAAIPGKWAGRGSIDVYEKLISTGAPLQL